MLTAASGPTLAGVPSEAAQLKAAFVFNFSKYTEWPASAFASADAPLMLCLYSTVSDIGRALVALDGNMTRGRRIRVERIDRNEQLARCHLVFIEADSPLKGANLAPLLADAPVLSIGEGSRFVSHQGGVIGLVPKGKRLGFDVNLAGARQANLKLSSQVLALAQVVRRE